MAERLISRNNIDNLLYDEGKAACKNFLLPVKIFTFCPTGPPISSSERMNVSDSTTLVARRCPQSKSR